MSLAANIFSDSILWVLSPFSPLTQKANGACPDAYVRVWCRGTDVDETRTVSSSLRVTHGSFYFASSPSCVLACLLDCRPSPLPSFLPFVLPKVLERLMAVRHQLALKVGFESHAHRMTSEKMADNPDEILMFLEALSEGIKEKAEQEVGARYECDCGCRVRGFARYSLLFGAADDVGETAADQKLRSVFVRVVCIFVFFCCR